MELHIGEVIYKLRKEKGIKQEVLADAVGVSVAAVSKWESKKSYPDITLLPSIARFFNTTTDRLLSYEIEISNEEVMNLMKKCAAIFEKESIENGIRACEGYIRQHPNNMFLKFRAGSLYMMSLASATSEDEAKIMINKAIKLLEISSNSDIQEISESSKYILSSLYTMNEQEDKAEEVLLSLPKVNMNREDMLVGLYINQGKYDKAKKSLRDLTYKKLSDIIISLDGYISLFFKEDDMIKAKEVLYIKDKLLEIFDLENIYFNSRNLMFSDVYVKEKDIERALDCIENIIDNIDKDYNFKNHLLFEGIELFEGVHSKQYQIINLKKLLMTDDRYEFLKNNARYKNIVKKLENI